MQFQVYCNVYTLPSAVRYVEAVTPTLSKLHPSALIDGLHSQCLDRLKQQNKLKKLAEGDESIGSPTACAQRQSVSGEEGLDVAKTSSLQALFTLPRVSYQFSFARNIIIMIKEICAAPIFHMELKHRALSNSNSNTYLPMHTHTHTHAHAHTHT